jgi:20S proteasome alpha/beta subunit
MSVAAAFEFDGGVMLCADTKLTAAIKMTDSKLFSRFYADGQCVTVFAVSASDFDLAKAAVRECEEDIEHINYATADVVSIRKSIQSSLARFYKTHIFPTSPTPESRAQLDFLIGIWIGSKTGLYVSDGTVLTGVNGYECIGNGSYLSKYLIKQALGKPRYSESDRPTMEEVGLVAAFALESTIEHDESVGGEIEYITLSDDPKVGIGYNGAPLYPSASLPVMWQRLMWETLRKLLHLKDRNEAECEMVIDGYCNGIREDNKRDRRIIDWKPPTNEAGS